MKIDGGDCVGESFSNEDFDNSTVHYAFNNETKKCQEFKFVGCGGNENRFDSRQECWRMCYTPLKYFLTRVTEYLIYRYKDPLNKTNTTLHNSKQKN
ncbi:hypothetical protein HW555_013820 [Spodoptera exigua]|uniref:BPTI/Kunitz inhibitor domain-containing protein n=1 Tax=Spodoptera exigua TaxID=7107 RepID=A0A835KZF7_SPOEX|nr:hypothetical protein HW555_013820 [Spodoptera exigua]